MRVRVRGIYTTALTRLFLDAGHDVVQASGPIRERFDAEFESADHDVAVETTRDRQGVEVTGTQSAVAEATALLAPLAVDTFDWEDPAPNGGVFDARVTETLGGGAVCDLGETDGYLSYGDVDGRVEVGDEIRVQVSASAPPWTDRRHDLTGDVRALAGLATLEPGAEGVRVDTRDEAAARELAGMTDLLGGDPPEGWGIRWHRDAVDADMGALNDALDRAAAIAAELDDVIDEPVDAPREVATPTATTWVWFGREARFELDDHRRAVETTMPGHHRTKAASPKASAGVDLAEALCDSVGDGEFPFDVVTAQFGPLEGDEVSIGHGKPDGRLITLGSGEVVERDPDGTVELHRQMSGGGTYDALGVGRESGDVAVTKFREGRWWYPTVYRDSEGAVKGTYVNICTPVECFPEQIRYVDLHVDVVKHADGTVERVDDDELAEAVEAGNISEELAEKARSVASSLESALSG
jgi:Ribonuclease G/E